MAEMPDMEQLIKEERYATKVNDNESWENAINGMNAALTDNAYQWELGTDGLPVLKKK